MARKPNELKPRPAFQGNITDLIARLTDEIDELKEIQRKGYNMTVDKQRVAALIALKDSRLQQIKSALKGKPALRARIADEQPARWM